MVALTVIVEDSAAVFAAALSSASPAVLAALPAVWMMDTSILASALKSLRTLRVIVLITSSRSKSGGGLSIRDFNWSRKLETCARAACKVSAWAATIAGSGWKSTGASPAAVSSSPWSAAGAAGRESRAAP